MHADIKDRVVELLSESIEILDHNLAEMDGEADVESESAYEVLAMTREFIQGDSMAEMWRQCRPIARQGGYRKSKANH